VDERLVQFAMPILRADCGAFETHAYFGRPWPHSADHGNHAVEQGGGGHGKIPSEGTFIILSVVPPLGINALMRIIFVFCDRSCRGAFALAR
jgi:hypothetical protein